RKVLLDDVALIAQTDNEIGDSVRGIDLHDMPQDRISADLHHRLRAQMGFLRDPRAAPAREDDRLHLLSSFPGSARWWIRNSSPSVLRRPAAIYACGRADCAEDPGGVPGRGPNRQQSGHIARA